MALTVVTDLLHPSCNSYASTAAMAAYLRDRVPDESALDAWNDLSSDQQAMYVVNATRTLDGLVEWIGDKYSYDQRLKWPRFNAWVDGYYLRVPDLPPAVMEATCEVALWTLQNDGLISTHEESAYSRIRVGPILIDTNKNSGIPTDKFLPDSVAIILKGLGTVTQPDLPGSRGVKVVRLIRA
jgi:hypothetical protein